MKVADFKRLVQEKTDVPVDRQRLVFMAKLLENEQTIGNYGKFLLTQSRKMTKQYISWPK